MHSLNDPFDVSLLVAEAQPIAEKVAQIYWKHTEPWFIGLLIHGSALKGGVIPNCSDIDLQLFLTPDAFVGRYLPLDLSLSIHRELARINLSPFQYIQCYALPDKLTEADGKGFMGPLPNTYHMLAGELPIPEATEKEALDQAHYYLLNLQEDPIRARSQLLQHGGGRLERLVRLICTDVWPALYHTVALKSDKPLSVWAHQKQDVISLLTDIELKQAIQHFYKVVSAYYSNEQSTENALAVIQQGLEFIRLVKAKYVHNQSLQGTQNRPA